MLVVVVGPSGAGKDTLIDAARIALAGDGRIRFVRREITRDAQAGGEDHVAVDVATFRRRRDSGAYALHWEAHGLGYGIPDDIAGDIGAGRVVVASISRSSIAQAAQRFPLRLVQITAPAELLAQRLAARGREGRAGIAERLARSVQLPEGLDVTTIVNDGTPAEGAAKLLAVLTSLAECARPAGTAPLAPAG
jgi:phosphonate metabolism protein PhnN/1,5-bisphosphokinase (PRPP-forming)